MGDKIRFSIVTVCLNSKKSIARTIDSVLSQRGYVQYIIIDGGSTDGTIDIINQYQSRISVIISEEDNGIYDAMNKAIKYCKGDVVAFINSDDWYVEGIIEKVAAVFQERKPDIVVGDYFSVDNQIVKKKNQGHIGIKDIKAGIMFCHQSVFCRKTLFDEIGIFDTQYKISADYDWLLRAVTLGKRIEHITKPVCYFSSGGISDRNESLRIQEVYEIAMKHVRKCDDELIRRIKLRREYSLKCIKINEMIMERKWDKIADDIKKFSKDKGLYLFGLSIYTEFALEMCLSQGIFIKGIIDNDSKQWGKQFHNINITSPDSLKKKKERVLIISARYIPEIEEQLTMWDYKRGMDYIVLLDICYRNEVVMS